jgi:hypothetical protein
LSVGIILKAEFTFDELVSRKSIRRIQEISDAIRASVEEMYCPELADTTQLGMVLRQAGLYRLYWREFKENLIDLTLT